MVKKTKDKISILTKVEKTIDNINMFYPDFIKIDTLVDEDENEDISYFLITETGEEIKGNYSHIIKLYNAGLNTGASPDLHKYWHIATQPQQSV